MMNGKGAMVVAGLAVVWGAACGTHSAIGNLNGSGGAGGGGGGGSGGVGGSTGIGGTGPGGLLDVGGSTGFGGASVGGATGTGTGGYGYCPPDAGAPTTGGAKSFALQPPVDYSTGAGALAVATGDVNGDRKLDLILLDQTAGVRVMLNNGNGTFASPVDHSVGSSPLALAVGDLNGDGKIDIATVTQQGVSVILNQGNGVFGSPINYVVGIGSVALALGDLNGDGKVDIAVADQGTSDLSGPVPGDVAILLNTGGGMFVASNYPASRLPTSIAIGDLDNDCQPDVVVGGADGLTVMINASGSFPSHTNFANGTSGASVAIADLDGDGKLDLVEGDGLYNNSGATYVLLNRGNAVFTAPIAYRISDAGDASASAISGQAVAVGDMNGDGKADLLVLGSCCGLGVFLNHGDGTFATPLDYPMAPLPLSLALGDLTGDGQSDVAVVSSDGSDGGRTSNLRVTMNGSH